MYWLALLAEAYGGVGEIEKATRALDEGIELSIVNGEAWWQSDLYRLKGELIQGAGSQGLAEAESHILRAIEIAQQQGARSLELRAVMACGKLWSNTGRREEARARLQAIYKQFAEGHDTGDLQEARALLNEWAGSGV